MNRLGVLLALVLGLALAGGPAAADRDRVRVTTANIKVTLGPGPARVDLRRAMVRADVVLAQEMSRRRMDVTGWGRWQSKRAPCAETPLYWRKATMKLIRAHSRILQASSAFRYATRCASVGILEARHSGHRFAVVNVHEIPYVERSGHVISCCPRRGVLYARGMATLDDIRAKLRWPEIIGGDWNVDVYADCRIRWPGFPCAHLAPTMNPVRVGGSLGPRQVDTLWATQRHWRLMAGHRIRGTRSDHDFTRAVWRVR